MITCLYSKVCEGYIKECDSDYESCKTYLNQKRQEEQIRELRERENRNLGIGSTMTLPNYYRLNLEGDGI